MVRTKGRGDIPRDELNFGFFRSHCHTFVFAFVQSHSSSDLLEALAEAARMAAGESI